MKAPGLEDRPTPAQANLWRRLVSGFGWTRSSYFLMSLFLATVVVIGVVWWPLLEAELEYVDWDRPLWGQIDWLLLGIFAAMSLLIMAGADLKADVLIILVGLGGGLVIESWGTQTELWTYYTRQRPPLWIIPAWPIASLSIDRLVRLLQRLAPAARPKPFRWLYWALFAGFCVLTVAFVWPTVDKSLTLMSLVLCAFLILTPTDRRLAVLTFVAGAGLGYFLEKWGTTRLCWTYYTRQTPPLFAVLAHGMAAVAFWRAGLVLKRLQAGMLARVGRPRPTSPSPRDRGRRRVVTIAGGGARNRRLGPSPVGPDRLAAAGYLRGDVALDHGRGRPEG